MSSFPFMSDPPDYEERFYGPGEDPAWCYKCDRDTAFCECICYVCDEQLEDCQCLCALCETPTPGGGLCVEHKATWNEDVQGPTPFEPEDLGDCQQCGIKFNKAFELNPTESRSGFRVLQGHNRVVCLKCVSSVT